jgi:TRAP-type transport system periplasmic protein
MRTYPRFWLLISIFCLAVIVQGFIVGESFAQEKMYHFTFAGVVYEGSATSVGLDLFAERVNKESGGRIKIKTVHGTSLGGEKELIEAIQMGAGIEGGYFGGILGSFYPDYNIFNVPFLFKDEYWANKFLEGELGENILRGLGTVGLQAFGYIRYGFVGVETTKAPIYTPDDFVGLKIRTIENDLRVDAYKVLGANPITMSAPDALVAMEQGLIDGGDIGGCKTVFHEFRIYDMVDNMSFNKMFLSPCAILMSKKEFTKLPEDLQKLMAKIGKEVSHWFKYTYLPRTEIRNMHLAYEANKNLVMTEPASEPFRRKCLPLYRQILQGEKFPGLTKLLEKTLKFQDIKLGE